MSKSATPTAILDYNYEAAMAMLGIETIARADAAACATYFDASGNLQTAAANVARFDYDPVTHAPLGMLLEESRQNKVLWSNDYSQAAFWTLSGVSLGTAIAGRDGAATSGRFLVASASNVDHLAKSASMAITAGHNVCATLVVKTGGYNFLRCRIANSAGTNFGECWFDIAKKCFHYPAAGGTGWAIAGNFYRDLGSGWIAVYIVVTTTTDTTATLNFGPANAMGATAFTGSGTDGIYAWHAELHSGSAIIPCPSFIVTTGTAKTRAADRVTGDLTKLSPAQWTGTKGTVRVTFIPWAHQEKSVSVLQLSKNTTAGTDAGGIGFDIASGKLNITTRDAGNNSSVGGGTFGEALGVRNVAICSWKPGRVVWGFNGTVDSMATNRTPPGQPTTLPTAFYGHQRTSTTDTTMLNGWFLRMTLWSEYIHQTICGQLSEANTSAAVGTYKLGVNLSGMEFNTSVIPGALNVNYFAPTQNEFNYYHSKGIDLIRLPFRWDRAQQTLGGALDASYMGLIDNCLTWAAANGQKVILDAHNYGAYVVGGVAHKINDGTVTFAHFADFWTKIATRYAANTAVAGYELCNEPGFPDQLTWPVAAQQAIDAIRTVDMTHDIYVASIDQGSRANVWSYSNRFTNVTDPANKLVFTAHSYWDTSASGTFPAGYRSDGANPRTGLDSIMCFAKWCIEKGVRGHIGEFGVPNDPQWLTLLDRMLAYAKRSKLQVTYWAGGPAWGSYPLSCEPSGLGTGTVTDAGHMATLLKYPTN
jgi:endoglucanase